MSCCRIGEAAEARVGTRRSRNATFSSSEMGGFLGKSSLNSHDLITLFFKYNTAVEHRLLATSREHGFAPKGRVLRSYQKGEPAIQDLLLQFLEGHR